MFPMTISMTRTKRSGKRVLTRLTLLIGQRVIDVFPVVKGKEKNLLARHPN